MNLSLRASLSALVIFASLSVSLPTFAASSVPDAGASTVTSNKTEAKADGIDGILVSAIVKDSNYMQLAGVPVTFLSSRGAMDQFVPDIPTTNLFGKARFILRSLKNGQAVITAYANGLKLNGSVTVNFTQGLSFPINAGELIKIPDDSNASTLSDTAVYYYGADGRRYVFPNEKTYFTWYNDFSNVKVLPIDQMSLIPIGGNVTYRAGTRMIKFQTDTKTYIVTKGGVLRWAMSESVAKGWFGENWNRFIDDASEAFYTNYTFGNPVGSSMDLDLGIIRGADSSIDRDKGLVNAAFP